MADLEVFFDITCSFSNRARHWLGELEPVGSENPSEQLMARDTR